MRLEQYSENQRRRETSEREAKKRAFAQLHEKAYTGTASYEAAARADLTEFIVL